MSYYNGPGIDSTPPITKNTLLHYAIGLLLFAQIGLTVVGAGTTVGCSNGPADPCVMPPMFYIAPLLLLTLIPILLSFVTKTWRGIPLIVLAMLFMSLRLLDSIDALRNFEGGTGSDIWDGTTGEFVSRPTNAGIAALLVGIGFLLLCCYDIWLRIRPNRRG